MTGIESWADSRDRGFLGFELFQALRSGDQSQIIAGAPDVPGDTCPLVDQTSGRLDAVSGDLGRIREEMGLCGQRAAKADLLGRITEWEEELLDSDSNLAGARLLLEELRTANLQLRRSSLYWRRAFEMQAGLR